MNRKVSPELSDRCSGTTGVAGSLTRGLRLADCRVVPVGDPALVHLREHLGIQLEVSARGKARNMVVDLLGRDGQRDVQQAGILDQAAAGQIGVRRANIDRSRGGAGDARPPSRWPRWEWSPVNAGRDRRPPRSGTGEKGACCPSRKGRCGPGPGSAGTRRARRDRGGHRAHGRAAGAARGQRQREGRGGEGQQPDPGRRAVVAPPACGNTRDERGARDAANRCSLPCLRIVAAPQIAPRVCQERCLPCAHTCHYVPEHRLSSRGQA